MQYWLRKEPKGRRKPGRDSLLLIAKKCHVTPEWVDGDPNAQEHPRQQRTSAELEDDVAELVIREGAEGTDMPEWTEAKLSLRITRDVVRAELGRLARDLVQRAQRMDKREDAFFAVRRSLSENRPLDAATMRALALLGSDAGSLEALAKPGSEDYFAAREHADKIGRAFRAGFAAKRRRGKAKPAARKPADVTPSARKAK